MTNVIYKGNENLIEVDQLKNAATGAYVNDATVQVTINDNAGNSVAGDTFPKTMTYVTSSNGKYQAMVSNTLTLTHGRNYSAVITATSGGVDATWEVPLRAMTRTG